MKKTFLPLLLIVLILNAYSLYSQDNCKVLKPEISGKYTGKCKNGLANGRGTAEGIDKYEGGFKNGLPNGQGKYTWANGEVYNGQWKAGMKEGEGKYTLKSSKGADSTINGIWEKDKFVKMINPNPYKVIISRNIDRYSFHKVGDGNMVTLQILKNGVDNSDITEFSFIADNGLYKEISRKYIYYQVAFPLRIKLNYVTSNKLKTSNEDVAFEAIIDDPGEWEIEIHN